MIRDYLVFRLYGPMCSWGDIAVGEVRPSTVPPSKSAILGLIAAALGTKRPNMAHDDAERSALEATHSALAQGYGFAVRVGCARGAAGGLSHGAGAFLWYWTQPASVCYPA